ncbi:pilus assembly protein PilM [Cytobacillus spongiae]|jgi:type IV pilus assembly protein PilM|uniref:type IV pilus biogenesis protein PilM n=1 Tax=Cytobacillus spongiae TaxID=2901381 RepID=UPI001F1DBBC0|nr:pilus assembly protein PilM [Cytobacillus spongiae]UII55046.1 pilus assembly protein PilM [Cytobacillus spongiae]
MAFSLFSRKNRIINLVITDHSIRYVELKQSNPPMAQNYGERYLPHGIITNGKIVDYETLSTILEECVREWKIAKRPVRFIVPDSFVIIRKVTVPSDVKDDEIKGYLYLELGSTIHLPLEDPVFDAKILFTEENKKQVLIFAAPEQSVMEYSNLLLEQKLNPIAADISPLALYRLYYQLDQAATGERLMMIQLDVQTANICIFENHTPFFMHHLPIDYDETKWELQLNRTGEYELKYIGETNELMRQFSDVYKEVSRLMDFYRYSLHQGKEQVNKLLLHGDHPLIAGIKEEMSQQFDVPIEIIQEDRIEQGKEGPLPRNHYIAMGLALKEV